MQETWVWSLARELRSHSLSELSSYTIAIEAWAPQLESPCTTSKDLTWCNKNLMWCNQNPVQPNKWIIKKKKLKIYFTTQPIRSWMSCPFPPFPHLCSQRHISCIKLFLAPGPLHCHSPMIPLSPQGHRHVLVTVLISPTKWHTGGLFKNIYRCGCIGS